MKNKFLFVLPVVLLFTMIFTPAMASVPHLEIGSATIFEHPSFVSAKITVKNTIPTSGAFGTAIETDGTLAVTVRHGGAVLDSILQENLADPVAHNHYVDLTPKAQIPQDSDCAESGQNADAQVASISFESPGIAMWQMNMYKIWEVPRKAPGLTDALTMQPHDYTLGALTGNVVSFFLTLGNPGEVCVFVINNVPADLEDLEKVGGVSVPIDTTSLLLAGVQTNLAWIVPVVLAGAGFAVFKLRRK